MYELDFEKQIRDLEEKIKELSKMSESKDVDIVEEVLILQKKLDKLLGDTYKKLSPWQKVQVARHPKRPHFLDYIKLLIENFTELAGDRLFAEDAAIVGGIGTFRGQPVVILGQEKGHDIQTRMHHNFGAPRPEGYRKAQRLMKLADQFQLPVITLVDTAGAYPGIDAEERGQAEAIARSIDVCLSLSVPIVSCIIGEGGSGGAIAIAAGNRILMLENSIYSVVSPEGCASILWRSADKKKEAAEAQKLTAEDLIDFKLIDQIVPEPLGGAHRNPKETILSMGDAIEKSLKDLKNFTPKQLVARRRQKFLEMGRF
ncbi:MAG: acetyl-CoA carboxylase carboxyltransferase subunit alpha [Alphaproteobacteria bacterium RIFCSPLOWO2_01_FULL_45_8]|nr:MAG: acetyl-CoA carboxylase carboxyltransferase subunit alpha [Alphaproteobacteria bacterium GWB1_45_5]OFW76376.1 MAG: acetyl-CoA carboxylase carboxyltransferase subunit alpha [Alphaproteobacteria bacterium GWA1_45_9]OFW89349.1 MAG: acetyl-CoA carboxylase carboxyltransferase subunit alpha [Alphaproteobacteria bacterium RIFCSPHIGHO2_01_FULL_41_14]OFW96368.1 MAG: acetyl-CoA carboxylase carboxyltransferase subunit alpha [Alphaproteobacteria bacterium RIFCSPLOWO2_01_FULL_45_8]HCI48327.1 acetyl-C